MKFDELKLSPEILSGLKRMKYTEMTEVQERVIPLILDNSEVVVRSRTGTGKTAAFGVGMIENIISNKTKGLVLAPTRELAIQVSKELFTIGRYYRLKVYTIYGGVSIENQIRNLRNGFDIIVGTPGRILDHLNRGTMDLSKVKEVVLDEADIMLDMGFAEDIHKILEYTPKEKQMMLFSATMSRSMDSIIKRYIKTPEYIEVGTVEVPDIEERKITMKHDEKISHLMDVLKEFNKTKTLIFVATKRSTEYLCDVLRKHRINARFMHGDKSQNQRETTIQSFKDGRIDVLIATDVAARGLQINDVGLVINFDQANTREVHRHRIGRTGRMGKHGVAITFDDGTEPRRYDNRKKSGERRRYGDRGNRSYRGGSRDRQGDSRRGDRRSRNSHSGSGGRTRGRGSRFSNVGEKL